MKIEHNHIVEHVYHADCPLCRLNKAAPDMLKTLYTIRQTACLEPKVKNKQPSKKECIAVCEAIEKLARTQFDIAYDWRSDNNKWSELYS